MAHEFPRKAVLEAGAWLEAEGWHLFEDAMGAFFRPQKSSAGLDVPQYWWQALGAQDSIERAYRGVAADVCLEEHTSTRAVPGKRYTISGSCCH